MIKRASMPRDLNSMAAAVVVQTTTHEPEAHPYEAKDPVAVELDRKGGNWGAREARRVARREPQA